MSQPLESKLQQIFQFFTSKALATPWHILDHVSNHLSVDILKYIISQWGLVAGKDKVHIRAGFLLALLNSPKKKLAPELKVFAEQVNTCFNLDLRAR